MLTREQKQQILENLERAINEAKALVLVNYLGLKAPEIAELRGNLASQNITYKVVKNTLLRKILREKKIAVPQEVLAQPLAIAFSPDDEIAPCKLLYSFARKHEALKIVGGIIDGKFVDKSAIESLALIPGQEELRAQLLGVLAGPISRLNLVLRANLTGLLAVLKQYQAKIS